MAYRYCATSNLPFSTDVSKGEKKKQQQRKTQCLLLHFRHNPDLSHYTEKSCVSFFSLATTQSGCQSSTSDIVSCVRVCGEYNYGTTKNIMKSSKINSSFLDERACQICAGWAAHETRSRQRHTYVNKLISM